MGIFDGMECFIPYKNFYHKPSGQPWFTPECAAAIAHRQQAFHTFQRDKHVVEKEEADKKASTCCRNILRRSKASYAKSIQAKIARKGLGSREFWRITNKVLGRGKPSIPTLKKDDELISSSQDKADIFAEIFSANSTLGDQGHPLPNFPPLTDKVLNSFTVSTKKVAMCIKELDSSKETGPDVIPVLVLKKTKP